MWLLVLWQLKEYVNLFKDRTFAGTILTTAGIAGFLLASTISKLQKDSFDKVSYTSYSDED